jgi:probable addiction module antidote protein
MKIQTVPFDIVAELNTKEARREYLAQVLVDGDDEEILRALGHVAKARDNAAVDKGVQARSMQSQG